MTTGELTLSAQARRAFLKPSINWLLAFIPVTVVLEKAHAAPPLIFFSAALAIIPVAALIVHATEQISTRTGDAVGGLLNATFGNAPELIIATVALRAGLMDLVRASIIGAILANLLLALGVSMLLGGIRHHDQRYNADASRVYSSMMLLAVIALIVPGALEGAFFDEKFTPQIQGLNTALAVLLLIAYALYLVFMLKTHPEVFKSAEGKKAEHHEGPVWGLPRAIGSLVGASVLAAWMSEILVGAAEGTGKALGMSQAFIGLVLVAVVGGAAESLSAIAAGRKNKMDLSIGIALGSSIQIALFVAPVLVLLSWLIAPQPLTLAFHRAEIGALFLTVLIGTVVAGDGRANWYRGVQLIVVYLAIALLSYFVPQTG
ncbi:MAG TPA: calcium/proton exchanger [Gemmatimonadales bacterium]|nr:calcium/proton exchanger [Gemmatimonadales bacterium]